eukprot:CAMPEP_0168553834 /NCGR_PEP_ID=MMETSP0413-20121227/7456_1 /TAXON_ID=136452 /ORGANISM="Filamoeba nolandi, Strain NC-AS-23-1" /LENGTH=325 /DNA_ID=CAMNT_0008584531 /DNA_START=294 /DNA_END=1271 /DNA_ORIENTATION=-
MISYNMLDCQMLANLLCFALNKSTRVYLAENHPLNKPWKDVLFPVLEAVKTVYVLFSNNYYNTKYTKIEFDSFVDRAAKNSLQLIVVVDEANLPRVPDAVKSAQGATLVVLKSPFANFENVISGAEFCSVAIGENFKPEGTILELQSIPNLTLVEYNQLFANNRGVKIQDQMIFSEAYARDCYEYVFDAFLLLGDSIHYYKCKRPPFGVVLLKPADPTYADPERSGFLPMNHDLVVLKPTPMAELLTEIYGTDDFQALFIVITNEISEPQPWTSYILRNSVSVQNKALSDVLLSGTPKPNLEEQVNSAYKSRIKRKDKLTSLMKV